MTGTTDPGYWAGKKVVVTGGTGFLGKPTARLLESSAGRRRAALGRV